MFNLQSVFGLRSTVQSCNLSFFISRFFFELELFIFLYLTESMPNGTEKKPDFLTDSFLKNHRDGRLPYEGDCHYLGLRRRPIGGKVVKNIPTLGCKPHRYYIINPYGNLFQNSL